MEYKGPKFKLLWFQIGEPIPNGSKFVKSELVNATEYFLYEVPVDYSYEQYWEKKKQDIWSHIKKKITFDIS